MNIWISYLIDQMESYQPEWSFDLSDHTERKVTAVFPYHPELELLRPNTLYLCLRHVPSADVPVPENTYFVFSSDNSAGEFPNQIILLSAPPQAELLNRLQDSIDRYHAWLDTLHRLTLEKQEPQAYLDASEQILTNPILVQSPSFSLIAISKNASLEDFPFFDFNGTMRPLPEFLFKVRNELSLIRTFSSDSQGRGIVAEHAGKLQLLYNMLNDGQVSANLVCAISRSRLSQGMLDLFHDLCLYLRYALNVTWLYESTSNLANFALEQLIKFGDPGTMSKLLAPKPDWSHVVGTFKPHTPNSDLTPLLLRIQEVLPNSAVCMYEGQVRVILCVSSKDSEAVYCEYQFQRLQSLSEAMGGVFGLSYEFPALSGILPALQQSARALEYPLTADGLSRPQPYPNLLFYQAIAIQDILDCFFTEHTLEQYLPPEIYAIYRSDLKNDQNSCEILYHYLLTGKSLAATGQALHLHRNTVVYRLDRMKEIYNLRLDDPELNQLYLLCCRSCILRKKQAN